jgi:mono/diheme cytochrome c family protein
MKHVGTWRNAIALALTGAVALTAASFTAAAGDPEPITYAKDVSRILRNNCETCHHPNGIGPFSLTTYRQASGWSKMIMEVIDDGRMPPWHADPNHGKFANDRRLSKNEIETIRTWIAEGMPRGEREDLPEPIEYTSEWRIGEPDVVFEIPEEVTIQPTGVVPYMNFEVPTNFTEDKWIKAMEPMPGNDKVVHHIIVYCRAPEFQGGDLNQFLGIGRGFLSGYAPGTVENIFDDRRAVKIPAGSTLVFQMHYTPTGKVETDRSKFGLVFAEGKPEFEVVTATVENFEFKIPPHAKDYEVVAKSEFPGDALLYSMTPHMHYRGSKFKYIVTYPDGKEEVLLNVPTYDFNWQTSYILEEPKLLPKGTKLTAIAHFDNSEENPYNPDPTKPVRWGDQTWEEMMIGWMTLSWLEEGADLHMGEGGEAGPSTGD